MNAMVKNVKKSNIAILATVTDICHVEDTSLPVGAYVRSIMSSFGNRKLFTLVSTNGVISISIIDGDNTAILEEMVEENGLFSSYIEEISLNKAKALISAFASNNS